MANLPDISPDFSQPLPQVDPNSDLVPYRMSSTNPDQGEVVTTGYGPRARPPIQPPGGGGVGVPDMTGFLGEAMQHLPVDEALQATQAAAQYIAQRGYQRDIANGESAPKALLKWLPVMRNSTGLSEALQIRQQQQLVPKEYPGQGIAFGNRFYPQKPVTPPKPAASIQMVDAIQEADKAAADAAQSGDKDTAEKFRERARLLREQTKGQEVVTGYDDQGRPIVKVGKGVGGDATVGMATQAQEKLVKYKNSMELMNRLEDVFKPEHVGVRGVAGEVLVDKGLQQAAETFGMPDVANADRIQSRKLMVALREGLMREMNDGSRFSLADREEISKALPSSGIFESGKDAKEALGVVRRVLTQRSRNYARSIGKPPPLWTFTKDDLKAQYPTAQALVAAAKKGLVDKQEAEDALTSYY